MNTQIHHRTKAVFPFKKSLFILMLFSCCFTSLLKGQTSGRITAVNAFQPKDYIANNDLPEAYDPQRQMRKEGTAFKEAPMAKKTMVVSKVHSPNLEVEVLSNPCTEKLEVKWKGASPTAGFTLVDAKGQTLIPSITISNGSRLEFDLPVGDYQIFLQIKDKRYTQNISVH